MPGVRLIPVGECGLEQLDTALARLAQTAPRQKQAVMLACATCIVADQSVSVIEAELLRAVAETLGCPMPPLLPGQVLSN